MCPDHGAAFCRKQPDFLQPCSCMLAGQNTCACPHNNIDRHRQGLLSSASSMGFSGPTQRLCWPMEEVLPVASSWWCLKTLERARPRPSSSMDRVSTPTMVLLPESTFPMMATRTSMGLSVPCRLTSASTTSPALDIPLACSPPSQGFAGT